MFRGFDSRFSMMNDVEFFFTCLFYRSIVRYGVEFLFVGENRGLGDSNLFRVTWLVGGFDFLFLELIYR